MNHREHQRGPKSGRRALQCLALLLSAFATENLPAAGRPRTGTGVPIGPAGAGPTAYLPVLGAPTLRFAEVAPPPDLVARPPAGAPPRPALTVTEASVAQANAAAAQSTTIRTGTPPPPAPATPEASPSPGPAHEPEKPAPSAILPDEIRPQVRPEDFLPFFQVPGSATQPGDVTLVVPVPRSVPTPPALPPSSATYTQTQK